MLIKKKVLPKCVYFMHQLSNISLLLIDLDGQFHQMIKIVGLHPAWKFFDLNKTKQKMLMNHKVLPKCVYFTHQLSDISLL